MSTKPPVPPPLPSAAELKLYSSELSRKYPNLYGILVRATDKCKWAVDDQDLRLACVRSLICLEDKPFKYQCKHFKPIMQIGPTCGLTALSMLVNEEVAASEMLSIAKLEGFSNNGEMFSCINMMKLVEKIFSLAEIDNIKCSVKKGSLNSKETVNMLLNGAVLLVPYDADANNTPCMKKGHNAHWTLICGIIVIEDLEDFSSNPDNVFVLCRHGKSQYLNAWKLYDMDESNKNLVEFSPSRDEDGMIYILPDGGIGGVSGLRDQYLVFEYL